ncbi:hypothetical protein M430DRAFT_40881 [Amorphotheca resinae ATCC 22711]|uniref:Zn(2)-C6 fungal-type domain-containing protein n=1 Tax=Amorphotheca resinae ATCC 22711 TaxID=857342 RepID=A0A2T3B5S6_AMORE|nr:hypothetical protein M430DRAFT_40881 [Amorphotheca resinae ATCC 22711]PSS22096.1 hypothetical protein M430DRAFT_40881 [Amorphotheca resinae ATCC 22711]
MIMAEAGQTIEHSEGRERETSSGDQSQSTTPSEPRLKRKPPAFKACSECRQQKLRCEVISEPGEANQSCARCRKYKLQCIVDDNFKRVKKRGKFEELQREVEELRRRLAIAAPQDGDPLPYVRRVDDGVSTQSYDVSASAPSMQQLENISLSGERVAHLYDEFIRFYHPMLPLLNPYLGPNHFFNLSPLLGWTIVMIAARRSQLEPTLLAALTAPFENLLWTTIRSAPQSYHVVKPLCLLCTWPLPTDSSPGDPTFLLNGIMMQMALKCGLHRPSCPPVFGSPSTANSGAETRDRSLTWCVCNIVIQRASSINGQPSTSIYNWALDTDQAVANPLHLPDSLLVQMRIEKFCDKVTRSLYSETLDPAGIVAEKKSATLMSLLRMDYQELESSLVSRLSPIDKLNLLAASLHLHSFAFFIPDTSAAHRSELAHLYHSATNFISALLEHAAQSSTFVHYCPQHLQSFLLSASCTLLRLLHSSFATHLDISQGTALFHSALLFLRNTSISGRDSAARSAEVLSRMWHVAAAATTTSTGTYPLELRTRCRMSISHVIDSLWRWRESWPLAVPRVGETQTHPVSDDVAKLSDFDLFSSLDWV